MASGDISGRNRRTRHFCFPRIIRGISKAGSVPGEYILKNRKTTLYSVEIFFRRGVLPLADDAVAIAVDHVIHVNTGEPICHIRYHFLSSFVQL